MSRAKKRKPDSGVRPAQALARTGSTRAKVLFYALFLLAGYLGWRLYDVQVREGPALARGAARQQSALLPVSAQRGAIYTSDGVLLARSIPAQSIYASGVTAAEAPRIAARLAPILGEPPAALALRIGGARGNHVVAWKVADDIAARVSNLELPGISVETEETGNRFIPSGRLASTILGFVGHDEDGLEGVEYEYNVLLRGAPGLRRTETDQFNRPLPFAKSRYVEAPRTGDSIVLTLDSYLQYATQRILADTVKSYFARSGTAIVLDANTGAILALANVPDYDVRSYAQFPPDDRRDRAVTDTYEPGSTFKLVTAAAALESKRVSTQSRFPARDELHVGGATIHNAEDGIIGIFGSTENLEQIITYSHNVGAAEVGLTIGQTAFYKQVRRFGFGDSTQSGLPGESPGIVAKPADWSDTSLPTMSFGHGIAITPLALIRAYAAIANGGLLLRPRILDAVLAPDGHTLYRYGREVERRAMSAKTAATLRSFLRAVVIRGTGTSAVVPGYTTAGKTGTAQVPSGGGYLPGAYIASFVGYIPAEQPRYVILVKVDQPRGAIYGGVVAAPAFAKIARIAMLHAGIMPHFRARPRRLVAAPRTSKRTE